MPPWNYKSPDMANSDISFELERLFDPFNFDHIPEGKRMAMFKQRNMSHVKHYKAAVRIFGGPHSRKRFIIAPSMETPMKHRSGEYLEQKTFPDPPVLSMAMKPNPNLVALSPPPPKCLLDARKEAAKLEAHQKWINDRKKLRSDLNNMGINQGYLERKPDKTPLEKILMRKIIVESKAPPPKPIPKVESYLEPDPGKGIPQVKVPSPKALRLIDQFLQEKKMRLIDLFTSVDKNKNWTLSKMEFKDAMKANKVPLSDEMIEDLILALDTNCSDELDYNELSKGMIEFKKERRYNKRVELAELFDRSMSGLCQDDSFLNGDEDQHDSIHRPTSRREDKNHGSETKSDGTGARKSSAKRGSSAKYSSSSQSQEGNSRVNSAKISQGKQNVEVTEDGLASDHQDMISAVETRINSAERSGSSSKSRTSSRQSSSSTLTIPESDLRPEQYVFGSDEAMMDHMKMTRSVLTLTGSAKGNKAKKKETRYPSVIKTGDKAIDDHSMFSQLEGETGEMVNRFRQEKLREYYAVRALCREREVDLTKELFDKVLLHPPDKPHSVIMREIRKKSSKARIAKLAQLEAQRKAKDAKEKADNDRSRRTRVSKVTDIRHTFPKARRLAAKSTKMNLSTGKAIIKPLTECWMSFEEYEHLTSHMARQYQQLHGTTNYNAFWPGYLLDKLRLCMPPYDRPGQASTGSHAIFHQVKQSTRSNFGYNNDLNTFPMDCNGWVKYGVIDQYLRKPLVL